MKRALKTICMMMLAFFVCTSAFAQERSWEELNARYKEIREQDEKGLNFTAIFDAIDIAQEALEVAERQFGPNDPRVAESLYYLAEAYNIGIDYAQAEPLYKRALTIYEKANQRETLAYARVLIGLGVLYSLQGKYGEGLIYYRQALDTIDKLPEPNTVELARLLDYMALTLEFEKGFAAAEPYYKRSIEVKEKVYGDVHPEVAEAISVLASQYRINEQFAESYRLYKEALAIYKKLYGKKDPKVAEYLESVGYYHYEQQEYGRAEPYYKEALKVWEKIYGPDETELCLHLVKQGQLYDAWGRYDKAADFYRRELAIKEKAFGKDDPKLIPSLKCLFTFYDTRKNFPQAERYYGRLFAIREREIEAGTIAWYELLRDYAGFFVRWGRWSKAEGLYRRLLVSYEDFPGKNWTFEAWIAERLADLCVLQRNNEEAEGFYYHALSAWEKVIVQEKESDKFVEFLEGMVIFFRSVGKEQEAELLEQRAEAIRVRLQQEKEKTPGS